MNPFREFDTREKEESYRRLDYLDKVLYQVRPLPAGLPLLFIAPAQAAKRLKFLISKVC
jgi:hypothetical protein